MAIAARTRRKEDLAGKRFTTVKIATDEAGIELFCKAQYRLQVAAGMFLPWHTVLGVAILGIESADRYMTCLDQVIPEEKKSHGGDRHIFIPMTANLMKKVKAIKGDFEQESGNAITQIHLYHIAIGNLLMMTHSELLDALSKYEKLVPTRQRTPSGSALRENRHVIGHQ